MYTTMLSPAPQTATENATSDKDQTASGFEEDYDEDDEEDPYSHLVRSVRTDTGLEVAVEVHWPGLPTPLTLSTCFGESSMAPLFHGTQWAGTRVWQASMVALEYLLSLTVDEAAGTDATGDSSPSEGRSRPIIHSDTTLLELGAGLGVPSLMLRALRQCKVVVTDVEALVQQLQTNIAANRTLLRTTEDKDHDGDAFVSLNSSAQAYALDWSKQGVHDLLDRLAGTSSGSACQPNGSAPSDASTSTVHFDVILNCDCLFEPLYGSCENLVECQEALLLAYPNSLMLTVCERRNHDGIDKYLLLLEESPAVSRVERVVVAESMNFPKEVELYRLYGNSSDV